MGTLREDLESTSAELGGDVADTSGADSSAGVGETGGGEVEAAAVESVAPPPERGGAEGTAPPAAADGRVRDATGKFTKASTTTTKASQEQVAPAPSPTGTIPPNAGGDSSTQPPKPGESDATTRPPPSWKHAAWEDWGKVPASFRQEVHRREAEMQRYMAEHAPARQFVSEIQKTLAPMLPALQARGTTPQQLIADYARFDAQLTSRDPAAKATAVAQVIQAYGVDIEALAKAIDGDLRPQQRQEDPREVEQRIRAQIAAEYEAKQGQAQMSQHVRQVQEFAKSPDANLFNDDIRFQMAALIDAAAARGVALSLKDAYNQAVWANPATRAIVQQQEAAKRQPTAQAATAKAMAAGSSIKSRPASPVSGASGRSVREDLEETAAEMSGR